MLPPHCTSPLPNPCMGLINTSWARKGRWRDFGQIQLPQNHYKSTKKWKLQGMFTGLQEEPRLIGILTRDLKIQYFALQIREVIILSAKCKICFGTACYLHFSSANLISQRCPDFHKIPTAPLFLQEMWNLCSDTYLLFSQSLLLNLNWTASVFQFQHQYQYQANIIKLMAFIVALSGWKRNFWQISPTTISQHFNTWRKHM